MSHMLQQHRVAQPTILTILSGSVSVAQAKAVTDGCQTINRRLQSIEGSGVVRECLWWAEPTLVY